MNNLQKLLDKLTTETIAPNDERNEQEEAEIAKDIRKDKVLTAAHGLANKVFWLTVGWLSFVALYLVLQTVWISHELPSSVLIALLSSTTVYIVGALYVLIKQIFTDNIN
jgi:hypothetical protein